MNTIGKTYAIIQKRKMNLHFGLFLVTFRQSFRFCNCWPDEMIPKPEIQRSKLSLKLPQGPHYTYLQVCSYYHKLVAGPPIKVHTSPTYMCKPVVRYTEGHFKHETESPWPLHVKHSHWWKRWSRSKFTSHYAWRTNGVCERKINIKSTWIPTWHRMDHVSWSLGLFFKTISWR